MKKETGLDLIVFGNFTSLPVVSAVHPKRVFYISPYFLCPAATAPPPADMRVPLYFFCWLHFPWFERLANDTAEVKELWLIAALLGLWSGGRFHFSLSGLPPDVVAYSPDPLPPSKHTHTPLRSNLN